MNLDKLRSLQVTTVSGNAVGRKMALNSYVRPFLEGALTQAGLSREAIDSYFKELERAEEAS